MDPGQVRTGIYRLDATTTADTCDPARFTGSTTVSLSKISGGISIVDASVDGPLGSAASIALLATDGWALRVPADGRRIEPCSPSNSVVFDYALTGATSDQVDVVEDEVWTMVTACPTGVAGYVNASAIPSASCAATRELHYELVSVCESPCSLSSDLVCSCSH